MSRPRRFRSSTCAGMTIGMADCVVQRVSYTGDLGYEIFCDPTVAAAPLRTRCGRPGGDLGLRPFGMRAMMSLRLDRFFGSWLREFSPDYTAAETGLDRFISFKKNADFIGRAAGGGRTRDAAGAQARAPSSSRPTTPTWWPTSRSACDGEVVGFCTSGGYSHWAGKSVATGLPAARQGRGRARGRDRDPGPATSGPPGHDRAFRSGGGPPQKLVGAFAILVFSFADTRAEGVARGRLARIRLIPRLSGCFLRP